MVARKHRLAHHVSEAQVAAAIREAEAKTSGRILLVLSDHRGDTLKAAARTFERLRMNEAHHRNNVLFYVAPGRREFAIVGDAGIHEKLGQRFWDDLAAAISERIKSADLTSGIIYGIQHVGRELTNHFPIATPM
jgi:uncharacterized membrane protein